MIVVDETGSTSLFVVDVVVIAIEPYTVVPVVLSTTVDEVPLFTVVTELLEVVEAVDVADVVATYGLISITQGSSLLPTFALLIPSVASI